MPCELFHLKEGWRRRAHIAEEKAEELEAENERLRDRLDFVCRHIEDIAQDGVVPTAVRNIMENDVRLRPEFDMQKINNILDGKDP